MKWVRYSSCLFLLLLGFPQGILGESPQRPAAVEGFQVGQAIEPEDQARLLEEHLQKMIQDPAKRVEVQEFRGNEKVTVPRGRLFCQIHLPDHAVRGGNLSGTMVFSTQGQEVKRIRVNARVDIYANVWVARQYLSKHQELQKDDVVVENRNIALLPQDVLTEEKEISGKRTTLSVNGREVLRASMVEVPPLVKKGDRVVLLVENEQFRITTPGEALENGRKGDRVKLTNLSTKKEVTGRVIDANTIQIDFQ
jgi:flagellar basal body P-ring formation protein FlgA